MFCKKLYLVFVAFSFSESTPLYDGAPIEMRCDSPANCAKNSHCDSYRQQCICNKSHPIKYFNGNSIICLKSAKINEACEFSASCQYFDKNAFCNRQHICICNTGYSQMYLAYSRCIRNNAYNQEINSLTDFSDEYDSDEDEDDDSDEHVKNRNSYEKEFVVPIIVGIVLGSVILCAWSFAICRLYLKKLNRQQIRRRRQRILKQQLHYDENLRRIHASSGRPVPFPSLYSLVPCSQDPSLSARASNSPSDLDLDFTITPEIPHDDVPFLPLNTTPLISPQEEPLPGYEGSRSKESVNEAPPSYDEVMKTKTVEELNN